MKKIINAACLALVCFGLLAIVTAQPRPARQIAVTFDDLPSVPTYDVAQMREMTTKLLATLKRGKVPVIGFVNEGKLHKDELAARTEVLKLWINAGFELGNHTYSHLDMFTATPEKFQQDLTAGEPITQKLLAARKLTLRYFRHPYLNTGASAEAKMAFDKILAERRYLVAPVTVDNSDYMFAAIYADALKANDRVLMQWVADAYVPYMDAMLDFYEKQSTTLLGREIKQILLVHANMLNADHFGSVIEVMKKRGYEFITLDAALRDPAYQLADGFIGRSGMSWLQRWALTQKHQATIQEFKLEPVVPEFIQQAMKNRQ